jgi:hypothetical protein
MTLSRHERVLFALDPLAHLAPGSDEERIDDERFVLLCSPGRHDWSTLVGRVRLTEDGVETALGDVRTRMGERDRAAATWVVSDAATPPGLVVRLQGHGLEDTGPSDALLLERPPLRGLAPDLEARRVASLEDLRASIEVSEAAFGWSLEDAEDERSRADATFLAERGGSHATRILVADGARAIATGEAWFSRHGAYLGGLATLAAERGRGAMTSIVGVAWDEAVARGTPALVAHGGELSSPILRGLGFRRVGLVRHLVDRIG